MQKTALHTEEYKGFTINIYSDDDYDWKSDDAMGELHCDSRDLYVGGKRKESPYTLKMGVDKMLGILEKNYVYVGSFGSHSGVWLNGGIQEITATELKKSARAYWKKYKDGESFDDALYNMACDDVLPEEKQGSVLLVIPHDLWGRKDKKKTAESCWDYWQAIVEGSVYGYQVKDKDGDDTEFSCWGFVGSRKEKYDEYGGAVREAKSDIDTVNKKKYYADKYAQQIIGYKNQILALGEKVQELGIKL